MDWIHNPTEIKYKLSESLDEISIDKTNILEFAIGQQSKFVRYAVKIDRSSDEIGNLSDSRVPVYENDTLLLKCLVEGDASLYKYTEANDKLIRFFYTDGNGEIEQLIYKIYMVNTVNMHTNKNYQNQLRANLSYETVANYPFKKIAYTSNQLSKIFVKYNDCKKSEYVNYNVSQNKSDFNLNIRPGINFASMMFISFYPEQNDYDLDNNINFRIGTEMELVLPFQNNKWAIIFEPTYQYFNGDTEMQTGSINVDYQSIELPLGVRYSIFFNKQSKFYINAQYYFDKALNSYVTIESGGKIEIADSSGFIFSLGFQRNRVQLELRGMFARDIMNGYIYYNTDYQYYASVLGYRLF